MAHDKNTAHNPPIGLLLADPEPRQMVSSYAGATRKGIRGYVWEASSVSWLWGFRPGEIVVEVRL